MALFQILLTGLIILSILLSIIVPFFLTSESNWKKRKKTIFSALSAWLRLVVMVRIANRII